MEYGEEIAGGAAGDPAGLEFDVMGNAVEDEVEEPKNFGDGSGTKIDYSREPPVPF